MTRLTLSESVQALRWTLRETGAFLGCSGEQVRLMLNGASVQRYAGRILELEDAARDVLAARNRLTKGE